MSNNLGLYIHIPFCRSKCPYCDFFSMRSDKKGYVEYTKALIEKIRYWGEKQKEKVDTVYFGGGTPSVIGSDLMCEILKEIKLDFNVDNNAEITMEVNPASGKFFDFLWLKKLGLNRVSLGLQSANQNEL